MKKFICFLLLFSYTAVAYADLPTESLSVLFSQLDSVLAQSPVFIRQKEAKISLLRGRIPGVKNEEEAYWSNKMFYDEFYVYNADSAMFYVDRNIRIAQKLHKKEWEYEWVLNRVFLLSATGLLKEAGEVLKQVDPSRLTPELKVRYYEQMIYFYSHLGQYLGSQASVANSYYSEEEKLKEEILRIVRPDDIYYYWFKASYYQHLAHSAESDSIKKELSAVLGRSKMDSRVDAMHAYALAHLYYNEGDEENYVRYLIFSAIADIRYCNRDIASLEELSDVVYKKGDIDRAYSYINHCFKSALLYPNRVRVVGISTVLNKIYKTYQERSQQQGARLREYLYMVGLLSLILIIAIIFSGMQVRKLVRSGIKLNEANRLLNEHVDDLSKAHRQLGAMNAELQRVNDQLKSANNLLCESNYVKEEYIGYVFSICSNYIGKLEEYRKNINRKMKAGQFDEVKTLTSGGAVVQSELKEFYHSFDAIFLHIYPDFVNDFNTLLRPEEQIVLKEGELLNTELRIYALVRLGINDSIKIADFLHCSPQTVYNNRLKTRNKAVIPKEDFAEIVRSLGKMRK